MSKTRPLTNTEVKQAKPKEKVYKLGDGDGLQLRVMPSGNKTWLFDYVKPLSKKRSSLGLGSYPAISLSDARKQRETARELIAKGIDPKEHKEQVRRRERDMSENTFEKVASSWFSVKRNEVTSDYAEDIWRSLELHVMPKLSNQPIKSINAPDTIETLRPIAAKGNLETVRRVCQRLNEIMNFAVNTGLIQANPLYGIKSAFNKPKKNLMPSIKPDDLPELMDALAYASIKLVTRCLIEWQLHTMVRPNEAVGAKWSEIDFDSLIWRIPSERMKKNKEHVVPLTPETLKILNRLKPISGNREYIFPADRNPKTHMNAQTANAALKRMGFHKRLVAHGMRALASTTLNEQGFDPDVIEAALSHVDKNQVRRAYNRADYLERRREMMEWWSRQIQFASSGVKVKEPTITDN